MSSVVSLIGCVFARWRGTTAWVAQPNPVSYRQTSSMHSSQSATVAKTLLHVYFLHAIRKRAECPEPANGKGFVYFRETACWLRRASSDGATTHQWLNSGVFGGGMKDYKDRNLCISLCQLDLSTCQQRGTCSNLHIRANINRCAGFSLGIEVPSWKGFTCLKDKC